MKKLILFLLTAALLILPLSGCFADKQNEGTTPNNTTENTTPEETVPEVTTPDSATPEETTPNGTTENTTPEETTPEVTTPDSTTPEETTPNNTTENTTPEVTTPEATTPPENNQDDPPAIIIPPEGNQNHPPVVEGEVDKNSDLIVALVTYWKELSMDFLMPPFSFTDQIYTIEQGKQPLHVAFDPNDYYFVCAYNNEKFNYDDCTWVRYQDETAIQEYYNGIKLVKAFQINRSLSVTDILPSDKTVPDMEHFSLYEPVFENGINIADAEIFDRTFIYLNDSTDETIYYSIGKYDYKMVVIPCVYFENQYYLSFRHYVIHSDGRQTEKTSYEVMFGDYYDVLSDKAVAEKYSVTNDNGTTYFYVLVLLEDFVNGVLK